MLARGPAVIVVSLLVACQTQPQVRFSPQPPPSYDAEMRAFFAEEEAIRVAVFKNQMSSQRTGPCFLSLSGSDPGPEIMRHFVGHVPAVKPASACEHVFDSLHDGLRDKETREWGVCYSVGDIEPISDTEVEVWCSYYAASDGGGGFTCRLKKISGRWKVIEMIAGWFS